jgi:hypothetical protein
MPTNHGIYRKLTAASGEQITAAEAMVFRCGILQIFQALKTGLFLATPGESQRAAQLEHHFWTLCQRFVFALQELNGLIQEVVHNYSHCPLPIAGMASMRIHFQAECLADHVLTYLNTIVDDVAIVTALATGFLQANPIDNMGKLRSLQNRNDPALSPVKTLLDHLDRSGSWWELAFKQKQGARQLLVHNQHLVEFQGYLDPGGPFKAQAVLMSPFAQNVFACSDFFGLLGNILSDLFGWLDRLEIALTTHLNTKSASWSPRPTCPAFLLPVGYPTGVTRYDTDYFPIPLCDGSDPLPWTVSVQSGESI